MGLFDHWETKKYVDEFLKTAEISRYTLKAQEILCLGLGFNYSVYI